MLYKDALRNQEDSTCMEPVTVRGNMHTIIYSSLCQNSTPTKYKQSLKSVSTLSYKWDMDTNRNIVGDGTTKLEWNHKGFSLNMAREVSFFFFFWNLLFVKTCVQCFINASLFDSLKTLWCSWYHSHFTEEEPGFQRSHIFCLGTYTWW